MNHFSTGLWYATTSGFYTTTGNDQLSCWTEKKLQSTSQSQSCTKKRSAVIGLLPVWSTTAFWIPGKLFHLKSMLSKSMRRPVNCNACSQHSSTERAQFFSMTTPYCTSHNQCFKSWMNWAIRFASSAIFTWPLANQLPLLQASWQLFGGKTFPQPAGGRKCFPRVPWILKDGFLYYRNKLISRWQKRIDCNAFYFD